MTTKEDEWLWGWDDTPGIVSVWAEPDGRAFVWRSLTNSGAAGLRRPTGELVREESSFRPWMLLSSLRDLSHLGRRLRPEREGVAPGCVTFRELEGPGELLRLVRADDARTISDAVLRGASRRYGRALAHLRELGRDEA